MVSNIYTLVYLTCLHTYIHRSKEPLSFSLRITMRVFSAIYISASHTIAYTNPRSLSVSLSLSLSLSVTLGCR
jgi:hypothetical protein